MFGRGSRGLLEALESFGVKYFSPVGTPFEEIARFLFEEGRRRDNGA